MSDHSISSNSIDPRPQIPPQTNKPTNKQNEQKISSVATAALPQDQQLPSETLGSFLRTKPVQYEPFLSTMSYEGKSDERYSAAILESFEGEDTNKPGPKPRGPRRAYEFSEPEAAPIKVNPSFFQYTKNIARLTSYGTEGLFAVATIYHAAKILLNGGNDLAKYAGKATGLQANLLGSKYLINPLTSDVQAYFSPNYKGLLKTTALSLLAFGTFHLINKMWDHSIQKKIIDTCNDKDFHSLDLGFPFRFIYDPRSAAAGVEINEPHDAYSFYSPLGLLDGKPIFSELFNELNLSFDFIDEEDPRQLNADATFGGTTVTE